MSIVVPTIRKPDNSKTDLWNVRFSNGQISDPHCILMAFEYQTIWHPTSFWPFEYPMYSGEYVIRRNLLFRSCRKLSKICFSLFQISLLEFLFRVSSSTELAHNLFPSRPELGRAFVSISRGEFEIDARVFINLLNKSLGERKKVWTLPCIKAEVRQTCF